MLLVLSRGTQIGYVVILLLFIVVMFRYVCCFYYSLLLLCAGDNAVRVPELKNIYKSMSY